MEKSTYKKPLLLVIIAVALVTVFFLFDTMYALVVSPDITHQIETIGKNQTQEGCTVRLRGNIEIDYRLEISEITIEGRIGESTEVREPTSHTAQKTIEDPGEKTDFQIEIETDQECDILVHPSVDIISVEKTVLQNRE